MKQGIWEEKMDLILSIGNVETEVCPLEHFDVSQR